MRLRSFSALALFGGICLFHPGCAVMESFQNHRARMAERQATEQLRTEADVAHLTFRAQPGWKSKKRTFRNEAVLALATSDNISIEISLSEQRGLLLVRGAIAMDFPIASGKTSHPTPKGSYQIRAKKRDYRSNLYGKIVSAEGEVLVADADTRRHEVPEGASFSGASMPFWMRLTDTGVGLHVGHVPGRPASHGCIRLRRQTAGTLFSLVKTGTPVVIAEEAPSLADDSGS